MQNTYHHTLRVLVRPGRVVSQAGGTRYPGSPNFNPSAPLSPQDPTPVYETTVTDTVNGRSYSGAPGAPLDVPYADGCVLAANGWINVASSGPTVARPTAGVSVYGEMIGPGTKFYDSDIGSMIVFDGQVWRSPVTGAVV